MDSLEASRIEIPMYGSCTYFVSYFTNIFFFKHIYGLEGIVYLAIIGYRQFNFRIAYQNLLSSWI